jgi:hypothetical protein
LRDGLRVLVSVGFITSKRNPDFIVLPVSYSVYLSAIKFVSRKLNRDNDYNLHAPWA